MTFSKVKVWSPEEPYLYPVKISCADDRAESYLAMRSIEKKMAPDGFMRFRS